jgi:hypothetical protein
METGFAKGKYILILLLIFSGFGVFSQPTTVPAESIRKVDTNIYVILRYDSLAMMAMNWRYKNARPGHLTELEVDCLEPLIDSAYRSYTRDSTAYLHDLLPLTSYLRQYVAVITEKGEREVWVNLICGAPEYWRRASVIVDDGGKCFVQLFINLTRRKVYELSPGGLAWLGTPINWILGCVTSKLRIRTII